MIETLVTWVSTHTSEKVLRIAATATASGISTAGSVPNTNSSTISAPTPPIRASAARLALPPPDCCLLASPSASRPVTSTEIAGREAGLRGRAHPLGAAEHVEARRPRRVDDGERGVPVRGDVLGSPVEKNELERAPGSVGDRPLDGAPHLGLLRDVARAAEHDDVRRAVADAERLERALAGLVGRRAGDRRALVPARVELPAATAPTSVSRTQAPITFQR